MPVKHLSTQGLMAALWPRVVWGIFYSRVDLWMFCAGMSGGGTLVPLLRCIFNFYTSDAIVLSNLSLATVAVLCFVLNFRKTHPLKTDLDGKPCGLLIEYNLAIVMLPMGVIGSAVGAMIPVVLPEPYLIAVLTLALVFVTVLTAYKLILMRRKESQTGQIGVP